jgi:hypothetical protein
MNNTSHPYQNSFTDANTPYDFTRYNHISTNSLSTLAGMSDINRQYRNPVGYQDSSERYNALFSADSVMYMRQQITNQLQGVHPQGRNIIVPEETVRSVADSVYNSAPKELFVMQDMVIAMIVSHIKTEFSTVQKNNSYSAWVTLYDETTGMQRHVPDIKLNRKNKMAMTRWTY